MQWVNGWGRRVRGDGRYENGSRSSSSKSSSSSSGTGTGSNRSGISQAWAACQFLAVQGVVCIEPGGI